MTKDDAPQTPFKMPTNVANWLLSLSIIAVCVVLSYLIDEARGWAAGSAIGALALLIQFARPLRREMWFWTLAGAFAIMHIWAVYSLNWSWVTDFPRANGLHGYALKLLASLMVLDLVGMSAITYGLYRLKYGNPVQSVEPSEDELPSYSARDIHL